MNYYEILAIARDADKPQIKRAYFSMVKVHSPDKDPEGFKAVRLAYETLSDDKKRAEYDTYFSASGNRQNEILRARELMRQNKYKDAAEFLSSLRVVHPDAANADILRLQAEALWRCRKSGKADDLCRDLLDKNPRDMDTLLLRARIAESRGHVNKADTYYNEALAINPNYPPTWMQYMNHVMTHYTWRTKEVGIRALNINPDMFREDYILYLHFVCCDAHYAFSLFDSPEMAERITVQAFATFTECFLADAPPDLNMYRNTLGAISQVIDQPAYIPYIEKLLPVLQKCKHNNEADAEKFDFLLAAMAIHRLYADKRIHEVLADLTGYFLEGEKNREERWSMEYYIVSELPGIRKSIKALRDHYPDYFKLNQAFYMDALNDRKTEFLNDKYHGLYKRLQRGEAFSEDWLEEDGEPDAPETTTPFVRETPKIGRNDPCPCGSGKKYKKCCGR